MRLRSLAFVLSAILLAHAISDLSGQTIGKETKPFVTRDGDRLLEGDREFRFLSFNIPNLHYVEDDLRFDQSMPFRFPDAFEIEDALTTIDQVGGRVVRMYALSVRRADDPADMPRHIVGPGQLNEQALVVLDQVIAAAGRHDVRMMIPFIDQWSWWGGTTELAGFRGKPRDAFWTDPQLLFEDYQAIVAHLVQPGEHRDGPWPIEMIRTILAWETGNKLGAPDAWTAKAGGGLHQVDWMRHHLVLDGTQAADPVGRGESRRSEHRLLADASLRAHRRTGDDRSNQAERHSQKRERSPITWASSDSLEPRAYGR